MLTFGKRLQRLLCGLLVLLLCMPCLPAFAAEVPAVLTVTCRDVFRQEVVSTATVLETGTGYYVTLPGAVDMLGLKPKGDHYASPNGLVDVYPDTDGLPQLLYDGETWYALEQLMTRLDTVILASGGELCYSCVPINQSLLQAETGRIMTAEAYNAFMLEDLPGLSLLTSFAFTFDNLWNQPLNALTGKALANDIGAVLLEVLKHHEGSDSAARVLSEKLEGLNDVRDLVLKAHSGLENIFELADAPFPGGGYLLFGIEGTGLLHEIMEANSAVAKTGMDLSDMLDVAAQLYETGRIPPMYANALSRVLDTGAARDYGDTVLLDQAERALGIYRDHLEDNRAALAKEGFLMTLKDIANNLFADRVLKETLAVKWTKYTIEILDTIPGNPFGNTFQKNKFVKNAALCVKLQTFFRNVFNSNNVGRCDGEAALVLRDAAMLYLKTAWTAYDAAGFDSSLAGHVRRVQSLLDDELVLLAGFSDGMFCTVENLPLPAGSLDHTGPVSGGETGGDSAGDRSAYLDFLRTDRYVDHIDNPFIREACREQYIDNYYTFRDLNSDGVEDLILWLGYTGADGEIMTFTLNNGTVRYTGSAPCDGTGTHLFCADHDDDFFLAAFDGGEVYASSCRMVRGELKVLSIDAEIPQRWYCVEWIGSLPLEAVQEGPAPAGGGKEKAVLEDMVSHQAYVFFLENGGLFDAWMEGFVTTRYWYEDMDNNGTPELIVLMEADGQQGEILIFCADRKELTYLGSIACGGSVRVSGHATVPGILIVGNDGYLEQITLCELRGGALELTEYYMITDTGWYALES